MTASVPPSCSRIFASARLLRMMSKSRLVIAMPTLDVEKISSNRASLSRNALSAFSRARISASVSASCSSERRRRIASANPLASAAEHEHEAAGQRVEVSDPGQLRHLRTQYLDGRINTFRAGQAQIHQPFRDGCYEQVVDRLGVYGNGEIVERLDQLGLDILPRPRDVDDLFQRVRPLPREFRSIHRTLPVATSLVVLLRFSGL